MPYHPSYGPRPFVIEAPHRRRAYSLEFYFWLDEARHAAPHPGLRKWHAAAIANAIGWGSRV